MCCRVWYAILTVSWLSGTTLADGDPGYPINQGGLKAIVSGDPSSQGDLKAIVSGDPSSQGDLKAIVSGDPSSQGDLKAIVSGDPGYPNSQGDLKAIMSGDPGYPNSQGDLKATVSGVPGYPNSQGDLKATVSGDPGYQNSQGDLKATVRGDPGYPSSQGYLKAIVRQLLLEDSSTLRQLVSELLKENHQTVVTETEDLKREIKSLQEQVGHLTDTVAQQQNQINRLEKEIARNEIRHQKESGTKVPSPSSFGPAQPLSKTLYNQTHSKAPKSKALPPFRTPNTNKRFLINAQANYAFCAYLDYRISAVDAGHVIKYNRVVLNDGNAYNTNTGVFTVPTSGIYLFTFFFSVHELKAELRLVVDNVNQVGSIAGADSGVMFDVIGGNTAIVRVIAGQSVWIETYLGASHYIDSGEQYRKTTFSGLFLYA